MIFTWAKKVAPAVAAVAALAAPVVVGMMNAPLIRAQSSSSVPSPATAKPKFEVASVNPGDRRAAGGSGSKSEEGDVRGPGFEVEPKRFVATNVNLFTLVVKAYGLNSCRPLLRDTCILLSGGPGWFRKDGFDIAAKMPGDTPDYTLMQFQNGQAPQLQLMLQALLADRFHLKVHGEKKQLPVFALTVGNKGSRLKKAEESERPQLAFRPPAQSNGEEMVKLVVQNSSIQQLTDLLSIFMDRPVLNQTGLKDKYDFTLDYEANADAPSPLTAVTGPGLFRSLQEQAGLKLEATKDSVEVLVVDHVEKPSEN
jgi:uncharacterized protein (TIGR03435 family)